MNTHFSSSPPEGDAMDDLLVRVHPKVLSRIRTGRRSSRGRRFRVAVGCAVLVLAGGGVAVAATVTNTTTSGPQTSKEHSQRLGLPSGTLPDGRTYGAIPVPPGNQLNRTSLPDLQPATGDHGRAGLVDTRELSSWEPTGPCQSTQIAVYALDGKTQIDTLTIGRGTEAVEGLRLTERSGDACE